MEFLYKNRQLLEFFQVVDNKFEGTLTVLVHNASQIFVPESHATKNRSDVESEIGEPETGDTIFGNLLRSQGNQTNRQHGFEKII